MTPSHAAALAIEAAGSALLVGYAAAAVVALAWPRPPFLPVCVPPACVPPACVPPACVPPACVPPSCVLPAPERARLLVADGVIASLGFKTAATLLKTLDLASWRQVAAFAAVLALRTGLKHVFTAERAAILRVGPRAAR